MMIEKGVQMRIGALSVLKEIPGQLWTQDVLLLQRARKTV